jgi:DNA-binding PucR family transcriptional regulator
MRPPSFPRTDGCGGGFDCPARRTFSYLAALIEPVAGRPELLETLKALITADGNRARAASELIIHRSTIDYRLRRIEELTGHSPTSVSGMRTLCTALAARALLRLHGTSSQPS